MSSLGERIRRLRFSRGVSQAELAAALGVSRQTVWNWENGATNLPSRVLPEIARTLDVSVADLYGEEEKASPPDAEILGALRELLGSAYTPGTRLDANVIGMEQAWRESDAIPIYAWGTCGPIEGEGAAEPLEWAAFPDDVEESLGSRPIGVRVRGRSMVNRGIEPGSTCYVRVGGPSRDGDVVLARVWGADGSEIGMAVKVLSNGGGALYSDGDDGNVAFEASRFDVIGPVVSVRPPARRPLAARDSLRRRLDMRSGGQRLKAVVEAASELTFEQRQEVIRSLLQQDALGEAGPKPRPVTGSERGAP